MKPTPGLLAAQAWWVAQQTPSYIEALHPAQRAFVEDRAKKKAAVCSRRAGKTEGVAAWLLQGAEASPGALSVYIALTRNNARLILWRTLEDINRRHDAKLWFREIDGQLMVQHSNGHRIWLAGCKDSSEVDKFRGMKYRRAAVDEAASYGSYLRTLIDDVLEPALLDHDGELVLVGTPGAQPAGLFYEATTGDGGPRWSTHSWTVLDNPYIPHAAEWLEQKKAANNWDDQHPTYQREWLGRWVRDDGAIIYPYDAAKNAYTELPDGKYRRVLGIDLGYDDSTAFVLCCYRQGHPEIYIERSWKRSGMIPSAIAAHIEQIRREHRPGAIVCDTGGLGKGYVEEFKQRYGLPVEPAKKQHKLAYMEMMRGDLRSGTLRVDPFRNRELLDEWALLPFNEDRSGEDERFENHLSDAALYAWREARAYYRPEEAEPEPGTLAAQEAEMAAAKRAAAAEVRRRQLERAKGRRW